jgi:hypothetical protein
MGYKIDDEVLMEIQLTIITPPKTPALPSVALSRKPLQRTILVYRDLVPASLR